MWKRRTDSRFRVQILISLARQDLSGGSWPMLPTRYQGYVDVFNSAGRSSTDRDGSALSVEEEGRGSLDLGAGDGVECLGWFEPVAHGYAEGSKIWPSSMEPFWIGRAPCSLCSGLYRDCGGWGIDLFSQEAHMAG